MPTKKLIKEPLSTLKRIGFEFKQKVKKLIKKSLKAWVEDQATPKFKRQLNKRGSTSQIISTISPLKSLEGLQIYMFKMNVLLIILKRKRKVLLNVIKLRNLNYSFRTEYILKYIPCSFFIIFS